MKKLLLPIFASFMIVSGIGAQSIEAASQSQITETAYKYIGVPYVYGGTTTGGFDCSGYTQFVFKQLGISLNRTAASQYTQGTAISKSNLQVGDLIFFNTTGKDASHVGIYMGNNKFAHAGSSTGVTTASLNDSYWVNKYDGARRVSATQENDFSYASRGEVALTLAKVLGLNTASTNSPFSDISSSSKYAGAVTALYKKGIFTGDENRKFNPNSALTREEMAKILTVAYNLKDNGRGIQFRDVAVKHWANGYIKALSANKVTLGIGNNEYGAKNYVTHTQLATFIERAKNN